MEVENSEHVSHAERACGVAGTGPQQHFNDRLADVIRRFFERDLLVRREEHYE
jgi:hypothetical protein